MKIIGVLFATMSAVQSWTVPPNSFTRSHTATLSSNVLRMADDGESDMEYSVSLGLPPLGIVFEDIGSGFPPKGVEVIALTSGGQGEQCGKIEVGDRLKTCSAVKFISGSSNFDIVDVDCTQLDFDTVVSAITSNQPKFKCQSVEMTFIRPATKKTDEEASE
mmetsp:Transcript_17673/g.26308  ORF Transcript_17673/g.26308 Transcript_17673/m.26308 type:complete len:162 (-) Transcript_17673:168-653(-)